MRHFETDQPAGWTCPCCVGRGIIPMPLPMLSTYNRMTGFGYRLTSDLLEPGIGPTAINRRLDELERQGFVERVGKKGKYIMWRAVE